MPVQKLIGAVEVVLDEDLKKERDVDKRRGGVTVDLAGDYPIFKKVDGQLVEIEKAEPGRRYGLVKSLAEGGTTCYVQYTDEEEAAVDAQKVAWDAGANERELEEIRIAEEAAKFEESLRFETRITALIDVLGWKNAVEDAAKGDREHVLALGKALAGMQGYSKFTETLRGLVPEDERWPGDPMVSQFSDSLLLSYSDNQSGRDALKQALYALTSNLIPHGLLLRGGVVRGKLFHQGALAFGPAIHEAYLLESAVASSPRIILSKELAKEWVEDGVEGEVTWRSSGGGYRFFNFLPPFWGNPFFYNNKDLWKTRLNPVRDLINSKARDRNCPEAIFAKYEWLAGYFDAVCAENPACGVDMVLLEAASLRWGR
jgi:hypothetical protein